MKAWTAHLKPGRNPVLVKEGFSLGAFLFGPLWLAAMRAWIPAALYLAICLAAAALLPARIGGITLVALAVLAGTMGRDAVRWSLERRGYLLAHVLAARDADAALARLLAARPDVASGMAGLLR